MATSNAATKPEYDQDVSEVELSYLTPDVGRNFKGPSDPNMADFAERMLRHGEEYAKWQAQEVTEAPDAEVQTLDAFQQDRAMTQQGREERLAINAIKQEQVQDQQGREEGQAMNVIQQDQRHTEAAREEAHSLEALHQTPPANDNQQRTPDEPAQAIQRDGREELFAPSTEVAQENNPEQSIQRDGREELFRPDGPEPDNQEQTQEQEQAREQQMEIDR